MSSHLNRAKYILFVDDCEDNYEALRRAFKEVAITQRLVWCNSAAQALDFLRTQQERGEIGTHKLPAFILLDLNMPGTDGYSLLQRIRQDRDFYTIPVIVFSSSDNTEDVTRCYQEGANSYVQKPIYFDGLVSVMQSIKTFWLETAFLPTQGG